MTSTLTGRHLVLALSGGIAGYKTAELVRLLTQAGASVQVMMTEAACQFITPVTMQALSGRPVILDQWDASAPNNMHHINASREADAMLVAPASADMIAKLALGRADDIVSLTALARPLERCPLIVAPAMNREM
ncbi:MAG: flavoprotein, partial [Inhella sp.]